MLIATIGLIAFRKILSLKILGKNSNLVIGLYEQTKAKRLRTAVLKHYI